MENMRAKKYKKCVIRKFTIYDGVTL